MIADRVLDGIRAIVDAGPVPGAVVGILRRGELSFAATGTTTVGGDTPIAVDALMRISSNTKPLMAALTLTLAEHAALALDDPVERFVPELAGQRVLRRLEAPLSDTVPAARSATVEDLLTMRLGFGFVFEVPCPAVRAASEAGLGIGPPDPSVPLTPPAWIARFARLPLLEQPGTVWRYDLSYAVLGVLLARAGGRPLDVLLRDRLLGPLGMTDTAFVAPPGRLPPCYATAESGVTVFDGAMHSRWSRPPAFPDARGGLVSTAADLLRFAQALLDGGGGVISPAAVIAMTTDHLTAGQRRGESAQAFLDGAGWGYGVQVSTADNSPEPVRRYGWGGGLGTLWYSWPDHDAAAVLLTQLQPPAPDLVAGFLDAAQIALG